MYCLDTNIILDIFRGDNRLKSKIDAIAYSDIFISTITLCELYKGAFAHHDFEKKVKEVDDFVSSFAMAPMDENSCKEFGKMYTQLKKEGTLIPEFDMMIASIVKVNSFILVTRDKHFKKCPIKVEVW
jgi:tRNA(fMet)-specific endonuclease VapC